MDIFGTLVIVVPVVTLAGCVWMLVDALTRPVRDKPVWVTLAAISLLSTGFLGPFVVPVYFFFGRNRMKVEKVTNPDGSGLTIEEPSRVPSGFQSVLTVIGSLFAVVLTMIGLAYVAFFVFVIIALAQCQASGSSKCY